MHLFSKKQYNVTFFSICSTSASIPFIWTSASKSTNGLKYCKLREPISAAHENGHRLILVDFRR